MKKRLTPKQKEYCRQRAKGKGYADAYLASGYSSNGGRDVAKKNAYNLENVSPASTDILQTIADLERRADNGAMLSRKARRVMLSDIVCNAGESTKDRIRATAELNAMDNHDNGNPSTVTVNMSYGDRLDTILDALKESNNGAEKQG